MQVKHWVFMGAMAVAVGLVGGCGDSTGPQDVVVTEEAAQQMGAMIGEQAASTISNFTFGGVGEMPLKAASPVINGSSRFRDLFARPWSPQWLASDSCASVSNTTDTDLDGVPDDVIVSFSSPACTTAVDESLTVSLSGSFRVTDPGSSAGFDISYSNLRMRLETLNGDYMDIRVNGTQGVSATSATASLHENITMAWSMRDGARTGSGTLSQNWHVGFTAAEGGVIDVGSPLPDGSLTLSGSTTWVAGAEAFAFSLTSPQPLVHDASCLESPTFTSGELRALVSGGRGGAYIRIRFVGCGQPPIVVLVAGPA